MNKYIEVLIKQNPIFEIECNNCKHKFFVKTKDVFSSENTYTTNCPKCHLSTGLSDIDNYIRTIEKEMKKSGIEVI